MVQKISIFDLSFFPFIASRMAISVKLKRKKSFTIYNLFS